MNNTKKKELVFREAIDKIKNEISNELGVNIIKKAPSKFKDNYKNICINNKKTII